MPAKQILTVTEAKYLHYLDKVSYGYIGNELLEFGYNGNILLYSQEKTDFGGNWSKDQQHQNKCTFGHNEQKVLDCYQTKKKKLSKYYQWNLDFDGYGRKIFVMWK